MFLNTFTFWHCTFSLLIGRVMSPSGEWNCGSLSGSLREFLSFFTTTFFNTFTWSNWGFLRIQMRWILSIRESIFSNRASSKIRYVLKDTYELSNKKNYYNIKGKFWDILNINKLVSMKPLPDRDTFPELDTLLVWETLSTVRNTSQKRQ